jgi:hypothetical protein
MNSTRIEVAHQSGLKPQPAGAHTIAALTLALGVAFIATPADARITSIVIDCNRSQSPTFCAAPNNSPTFGGLSFGTVGQYEKLRGTAFGELNPSHPGNAVITDIELVPAANRNPANGNVKYSMDIFILKPVDLSKGNQRVLLDFNNRGEMRLGRLNQVELTNDPTTAAHAGDGFVMRQGYTIVGNGWDFGATEFEDMKISVPKLTGITGPSYEYIVFDNATSMGFNLTFPANTLDKSLAQLTVRDRLDDLPTTLLASEWEYVSPTRIRLLPGGTAFRQSAIYEFTYTAKDPVVSGIGLAATRDFLTFLRNGTAAEGNPLAGHVRHTFSYSISQPSRTLNDFQNLGFSEGEDGRRALDGILSHTGGGSGDQINYRFGQTGRTERNRQNHLYPEGVFPFAHQVMTDHLSGKTGGRDERCTASGTCSMRFEVNSANEYWVKAGSLLHTDTHGNDLKDPEHVRYYLVSGTSHGVGNITSRSTCQQFTNAVSPDRLHRALLVALDEWVSHGAKPPKSEMPRHGSRAFAVPRLGFQTGVVPQEELGWPNIPGVTYNGLITTRYFLDFGARLDSEGIIDNYPPSLVGRPAYTIFVSKVDRDGNEIAGVRLPEVAAPVATTTGWALRRAGFSANEGCESNGQHIPFKRTRAERVAAGDPRLSLEERYGTHKGYVKVVAARAKELQARGLLLAEDVQHYIDEAQASNVLVP